MENNYLDKSNKLIKEIFESASRQIPNPNWESIEIVYEFEDKDVFNLELKYRVKTETINFLDEEYLVEILLDLIDLVEENEKSVVKKAIFTMDNKGKFDVKYTY